jgi:hypothetical protein
MPRGQYLAGFLLRRERCVQLNKNLDIFNALMTFFSCQEFKVKCRTINPITYVPHPDMKVAGFLEIDGKPGGSMWVGKMGGETVYLSTVATSATTLRSIMFSSIELTGKHVCFYLE